MPPQLMPAAPIEQRGGLNSQGGRAPPRMVAGDPQGWLPVRVRRPPRLDFRDSVVRGARVSLQPRTARFGGPFAIYGVLALPLLLFRLQTERVRLAAEEVGEGAERRRDVDARWAEDSLPVGDVGPAAVRNRDVLGGGPLVDHGGDQDVRPQHPLLVRRRPRL